MPELAPEAQGGPSLTPHHAALAPLRPPPWPGYPVGLEALTAREVASLGTRYGIDYPRIIYPLGFGEYGDVLPGQSLPRGWRYAQPDPNAFCAELFGGESPLP